MSIEKQLHSLSQCDSDRTFEQIVEQRRGASIVHAFLRRVGVEHEIEGEEAVIDENLQEASRSEVAR